jgi:uncharacterized membrane protein YtjA (UPF0391 family)
MLAWAFLFLVIAIVAAVFGFGNADMIPDATAQLFFYISLALFAVFLVVGMVRKKPNV